MTEADGFAARSGLKMLDRQGKSPPDAADKAYDTADFVQGCRDRQVTACGTEHRRRGSALMGAHAACRQGEPRLRKRIEEIFGWSKRPATAQDQGTTEAGGFTGTLSAATTCCASPAVARSGHDVAAVSVKRAIP